jgi:hypothetical protein
VDDLDRRITEQGIEVGIRLPDAKGLGPRGATLGRAAEHATHVHPDAAQGLDVDGADEARPDDRGADVCEATRRHEGVPPPNV